MMKPGTRRIRFGSSYLEVQVAMVLMAIGIAGLYSMSVVQTRQTSRLGQILPPDETIALNPAADRWERKLGVYATVADSADSPLPLLSEAPIERVLDDLHGSPRFDFYENPADTYGWIEYDVDTAYREQLHYHESDGQPGSYAEFTAAGLPVGEYEILTTYPTYTSLGTAIVHEIYDGNTLAAAVPINQRIAPSEETYQGRQWDRLAVVRCDSGTIRIRLLDGPNSSQYMVADAMLVRTARAFEVVTVQRTVDGGASATLEAP